MPQERGKVGPAAGERCRYCRRRLDPSDAEHKSFWPFCSERCKMAELGLWFSDRYVISRSPEEVADDAAAKPQPKPKHGGKGK